jgi:hypothetical protein
VKKFPIVCHFNGTAEPFDFYVGEPSPGMHPLHYQAAWLSRARNGTVPREELDKFARLRDIALDNGVSFEELCGYALQNGSDVEGFPGQSG